MLNFEEFCDYSKMQMAERLQGENIEDIIIQKVKKNNGLTLHGIMARTENNPVSATIYLERFYESYKSGKDLDAVMDRLSEELKEHLNPPIEYADIATKILDPEFVKERVVMNLVNAQRNAELLAHAPYTMKEDLAIIYKVVLSMEGDGIGSVTIRDDLFNQLGMSLEELHEHAMQNTKRILPISIRSMNEVMADIIGVDMLPEMPEDQMMYVISNSQGIDGASSILYDEALSKIAMKTHGDFYVLPSSTHEVICVSTSMGSPEELAMMVREINGAEVRPEEQLSDHVYRYCAEAHTLKLADASAEELQMAFVAEREKYLDQEAESRSRHVHR